MTHECVSDEAVAADVEKFGLSVMLVSEDEECPKFGYSIGLYRNFNHPEIIVFGLSHDVMAWIINEIAQRIRNGERCEIGKEYEGLLEGYNCFFNEAPKGCYPEYFGYAMSFYKGVDFPALQLVWPDKENKWPWEIDFNRCWSAGLTKKLKAIGSSTSQEISECSQQFEFSTKTIRFSWSVTMTTKPGNFYAARPTRQISVGLSA
jgi:Domain of unknown function (DUF4262)